MPTGFRAATAFVEITANLDERDILGAARRAAEGVDRELTTGARRAGITVEEVLTRAGTRAGDGMARTAANRLRDSRGRFTKAGESVGDDVAKGLLGKGASAGIGFAKAISMGMKGPLGPYLLTALVTGGAAVAPLAGATLAAGIAGGLSTGAIGAGIALALQDPEVKNAAAETGEAIGDRLKRAAVPMQGALLSALDSAEDAMARWEPLLQRTFAAAARYLQPLTDGLTGFVDRTLPSVFAMVDAAGPVFDAIERGLTDMGDAMAGMFDSLSDNGAEMGAAITAVFFIINNVIKNTGLLVNFLTETFGFFVESAFRAGEIFVAIGQSAAGLPAPLRGIAEGLGAIGGHIVQGKSQWEEWANAAGHAPDAVNPGVAALAERTRLLNQSMAASIREAGNLEKAFLLLNGGALSAREAESAYQAAVDNVTASIKANGRTLDLHTEKGRANDAALRALVTTTSQKAQATYDEVLATKGSEAAQEAAMRAYERGRAQLIKSAQAMGLSKAEAIALANRIMAIPESWGTDVDINDMATAKARAIRNEIHQIHGKTVTIAVKLETHGSIQGEHIIGQGTQLKAGGGEIVGGSGYRDDVPVLAMGGEWVIRKSSVQALERTFGPGFMHALNNWDGAPGTHRLVPDRIPAPPRPVDPAVAAIGGQARPGVSGPTADWNPPGSPAPRVQHVTFGAGSIVLDASTIRDVRDLVDMVDGLMRSGRAYTAAGGVG